MKRSTEWLVAGALAFGMAFFLWMMRSSAEQEAFWFGTSHMPPIQIALIAMGTFMIPTLVVFGIVCLALGLRNAGPTTVDRETTFAMAPMPTHVVSNPQNACITEEADMAQCEYCGTSIPKTSVFCPTCGTKRED